MRLRLPLLGVTAAAAVLAPVVVEAREALRSLGGRRFEVPGPVRTAPFRNGRFANRLPMTVVEQTGSIAWDMARRDGSGRPAHAVPLVRADLPEQAGDLAVTWLGHATALLEVGGHWVLTDPVWSERCSPSTTLGPRRTHPVPLAIDDLPRVDAIVISHDHYDHLDTATVDALTRSQVAPWVVPLGIGAHLRRWGVPDERIVELDWEASHRIGEGGADGLSLTCTEARHFSGRGLTNNRTLWSSWVLAARGTRVFFGGDTGYSQEFAAIGRNHGPFDLSLLPIGAYDSRWPDVHLDPEQAVRVQQEMTGEAGGGVLLPIHWATFDLAFHRWSEPPERLVEAAALAGVAVVVPRPGERVEPRESRTSDRWWRTAAEQAVEALA